MAFMNGNVLAGLRSSNNTGSGLRSGGGKSGDIIPKGYKATQLQQFTPEQMGLFGQLFSHVGPDSYLSKLASGDQSFYDEMESPDLQNFNSQIGNLASRFSQGSGAGSMGNRRSSGFQNTTTAASSNFAQDLASRRQGLQRQAIQDLMGFSSSLLGQKPYERQLQEKQQKQALGGWGSVAGGVLGGIGGAFLGQPVAGAAIGANAFSGM